MKIKSWDKVQGKKPWTGGKLNNFQSSKPFTKSFQK